MPAQVPGQIVQRLAAMCFPRLPRFLLSRLLLCHVSPHAETPHQYSTDGESVAHLSLTYYSLAEFSCPFRVPPAFTCVSPGAAAALPNLGTKKGRGTSLPADTPPSLLLVHPAQQLAPLFLCHRRVARWRGYRFRLCRRHHWRSYHRRLSRRRRCLHWRGVSRRRVICAGVLGLATTGAATPLAALIAACAAACCFLASP
jgi:hypothetical protein